MPRANGCGHKCRKWWVESSIFGRQLVRSLRRASASLIGSEYLTGGAGRAEEWTEGLWRRKNPPYLCDGVPGSERAITTYRSGWVGWKDVSAAQKSEEEKMKKEKKENRWWKYVLFRQDPRRRLDPCLCQDLCRRPNPCPCTSCSWSSHVMLTNPSSPYPSDSQQTTSPLIEYHSFVWISCNAWLDPTTTYGRKDVFIRREMSIPLSLCKSRWLGCEPKSAVIS